MKTIRCHLAQLSLQTAVISICASAQALAAEAPAAAPDPVTTEDGAYAKPGYGDYPRVTQLEQQLLGKTYVNDPLPKRVDRLEVKQFGKASTGDVCDRLDKLDDVVKPKALNAQYNETSDDNAAPATSYPPVAPAPGSTNAVAAQDSDSGDTGSYPRVTQLEQQALGKSYDGENLQARIERLETKEFSKTFPQDALCDRIDRLTQKIKPKNAVAGTRSNESTDAEASGNGNGAKGGSIGGAIGKALVNLVGGGMGGGVMGGPGQIGGMGSGMLLPGMMMGGMGPGMGIGMGGRGMGGGGRNRSQQNQEPSPPPPPVIQNPFSSGGEPVTGIENRTAAMEKFVFNKEHSELPIDERIARLEKKLVPYEHNNASKPIESRVDHLWSMLAAANKPKRDIAATGAPTQ